MSAGDQHPILELKIDIEGTAKEIRSCRSTTAILCFKTHLNDLIVALEQLREITEQELIKAERTSKKTEQNIIHHEPLIPKAPEKTGNKEPTTKKYHKININALPYGEKDIIASHGTTSLFQPILDIILEKTKEEFIGKDLATILIDHYTKTLKRPLSKPSAYIYSGYYITYMLKENLIECLGTQKTSAKGKKPLLYRKKKKVKLEGVENGIYVNYEDNKKKIPDALAVERDLCSSDHFDHEPEEPEVTDVTS